MKKLFLFVFYLTLFMQSILSQPTIQGVVKDNKGLPVIGATALVKGTNSFGITDINGFFQIASPIGNPPFFLEIRSVGFIPKEVELLQDISIRLEVILLSDNTFEEVVVTARRRKEPLQETPISISVVSGPQIENSGSFNVNRVKELVPSVQLYSSNPRNTALNIRGLGTTFGLTNDGIDPGVGFYIDGVYYARPAATALDFIDVDQIEVLRGPQGTLFGKNTTAGAIQITTRKPAFTPTGKFEISYGNYGYIQSKVSVSGPLANKMAGRLSLSGTQRDGTIYNVSRDEYVNDLNNLGVKAQLLYVPTRKVEVTLSGDFSRQRPNGYAQVFAGIAPTKRPAYRQFEQIIADLDYDLPSRNPFDRLIDHDTPWRSLNDYGGASMNVETKLGGGAFTFTSAYRHWVWGPSNDRDFTGLQALTLSQAPSSHSQWSQEIRYSGVFSEKLSGVIGIFAIWQNLNPDSAHIQESGRDQWRFSQSTTSAIWNTPGLFEGYGLREYPRLKTFSGAFFGQLDWKVTNRLHIQPGLRVNHDVKDVNYRSEVYGGLQTSDPALIAIKQRIYTPQAFQVNIDETNLSGQFSFRYLPGKKLSVFATIATSFKPVGLNLGGLPRETNGDVLTDLAVIKPEEVTHWEVGIKSSPTSTSALNLSLFNTSIRNYQTLVQAADLSLNRGYLANAGQVRVIGAELDGHARFSDFFHLYGALSYTEGKYVQFTNAPPPLEEVGGPSYKDISGGQLPGISKWASSFGLEWSISGRFLKESGKYFLASDTYYRSRFSSSPSPSKYLVVDGYALLSARLGFQDYDGFSLFFWARNLLNTNYFEQLLPAGGSAGHYAGVLGDPRTYGVTLRYTF